MSEPTAADDVSPDDLPEENDGWIDMGGYRVRQPTPPAAPTSPPAATPPVGPPPGAAAGSPTAWSAPAGWGAPLPASGQRAPGTPATGTDGFAIASLVTGLLSPLGLLFGLIAKSRIKRSGQDGGGLATAGIVLGSVWLAFTALVVGVAVFTADPDVPDSTTVAAKKLRVGDCTGRIAEGEVRDVQQVPCGERHIAEVFAVFRLDGASWPGQEAVAVKADDGCSKRMAGYVGDSRAASGVFDVFYLQPFEAGWRIGDRNVICLLLASDGKSMTRSHRA